MKFLHIDQSIDITGAYKALKSWCDVNPHHEHIWILPKGSVQVQETREKYTTYELSMVHIGKSLKRLLKYIPNSFLNARKLTEIINKEKIDVVHMNDFYVIFPYLMKNRSKVQYWVHGRLLRKTYPNLLYTFYTKLHLKFASKIIAVSRAVKKDWHNHPKVEVVYDPIFLEEALPRYHSSPHPKKQYHFLYLANYINGKGQEDALSAIHRLTGWGIENFVVDFYGSTMGLEKNAAYKKKLQNDAEHLGITKNVRFFGKEKFVEKRYKLYDAVLHFSHAESFCMVVYEALYYRIPTISTDCGGPDELIVDGETGLLVPVHDIDAMAKAMQKLITNPALNLKLNKNSGEFIRKFFPSEKNILTENKDEDSGHNSLTYYISGQN